MRIIDAIGRIDRLKPNGYAMQDKIWWLATLDGRIKTEVIDTHEGGENIVYRAYKENTDPNTELLVLAPYDTIYIYWLEAQIDYANGEYNKYANSMAMFNEAYVAYEKYYNRTHMPKGRKLGFFNKPTTEASSTPTYGMNITTPFEQGTLSSTNGEPSSAYARLRTKEFVGVDPSTEYRVSSNIERAFIIEYNKDQTVIGNSGWQNLPYTFVTSAESEYIRILLAKEGDPDISVRDFKWLKLESPVVGGEI